MTQRGYHFAVPIDDETAWSYFNEWDSADEARRSVLAESLGRYADEKEFEKRSNQETFIQNLFTDEEYLGQVSELSSFKDVEPGITILPEDQEKRAAVQTFLSFTLNRPLSGCEYEFQRDAFARTHFGKNAVSDPEIFSLIQDDFETKERQEQGLTDLLSITVRQVLEDRILGRPTESGSSYMHWLASLERQDVAFEKESEYLNSAFELEQNILSDIEPFVDDIAHGYDIVVRHFQGESDTKEEQDYLAALSEKPKEHQIAVLSYLHHSGLTELVEETNAHVANKSTPTWLTPDSDQQNEDDEDVSTEEVYSEDANQRSFDKEYPILSPILKAIKGVTGYLLGPFRPDNDDLALTTTEIRQRQRQSLKNIGSLSTESYNPTATVVTNNGDGTMSPNWEGIGSLSSGLAFGTFNYRQGRFAPELREHRFQRLRTNKQANKPVIKEDALLDKTNPQTNETNISPQVPDQVEPLKTKPTGEIYSVAFETKLAPTSYPGKSRQAHFREANEHLLKTMEDHTAIEQIMRELQINLKRSVRGLAPRKSPKNWTWHHAPEPGLMQLVPREQHDPGSIFQKILHPNRKGGYAKWGKKSSTMGKNQPRN